MNLHMDRKSQFRPSPLMMAYQFVFFTFYQIIRKISPSGLKAYRAALLVSALQMWLVIVVMSMLGLLAHPAYSPSLSALLLVGVPTCMVVYFMVFERGPWKEYVEYFERLPKRKLIIGRFLFLGMVLGLSTMITLLGTHRLP